MLSFDRILQVFDDILRQDPLYEVVSTSHGYTLLGWEPNREEWYSVLLLDTPEVMREESELRQRVGQKLKLCPEQYLPIIEGAIDGAIKLNETEGV